MWKLAQLLFFVSAYITCCGGDPKSDRIEQTDLGELAAEGNESPPTLVEEKEAADDAPKDSISRVELNRVLDAGPAAILGSCHPITVRISYDS